MLGLEDKDTSRTTDISVTYAANQNFQSENVSYLLEDHQVSFGFVSLNLFWKESFIHAQVLRNILRSRFHF